MANCVELGTCNFDNFFSFALYPYELILGDFMIPLLWGFVISLLYIKSKNSMLTVIIGIFLLTGLQATNSWINTSTNQLYFWAIVITAVGFGCSLFYLLRVRLLQP